MARLLMIPGPTPVDPEVLLSMAKPVISHTSPEFDEIHSETVGMLQKLFRTSGRVFLLPGSGSLGMEFAVRSVAGRGTRALVLKAGFFGGYFERILRSLGASVMVVESPVGRGFGAADVEDALDKAGDVDAVFIQHVETSTSVANPIEEVARAVKKRGARLVVDGIASVGGMDLRLDEWGVDVALTGSQKALSTPPGLAIVAFSSEYSRELEKKEPRGIYFDFLSLSREMESTRNYHITPAVNLVFALNASLKRIFREGLENRFERHRALSRAFTSAMEALGLKLVAEEPFRAWTVTAVYLPQGVEWPSFYSEMRKRGVEIAGGLGSLKGRIFRVGHMGEVDANDLVATVAAVERALASLGYREARLGLGLEAAQRELASLGL
ncbi:pyridoxal-phosphate-dependent aminotransferase family protein [Aeropyrum camini]|uniref:Aspartate aminotransferase n=1 Tax=Aeropyrum camini SY1 = JCM 12091 TaxID=1198449 RepID=U3TG63_9CREN|nr:alanine--glyoxylate aminotransferase family protein [Aeropyrum camini]BAN90988.1 aspartate aminotransferase [Aeropyrum camini SY1 = JCM 12091]